MRKPDSFEWIDLPVGPQPIPAWCADLAVDWHEGYGNPPDFDLKARAGHDPFIWPDQVWIVEDKDRYRTYSADGRLKQHAHGGRLTWSDERNAWLSTLDEGYGGHPFTITMKYGLEVNLEGMSRSNMFDPWTSWADTIRFTADRRTVVLRGPWSVPGPAGYHGVGVYPAEDPYREPGSRYWRPWHQRTGRSGLFITTDLLLRLIARYQPTLRVAAVTRNGYGPCLEPVREDWDAPKNWAPVAKLETANG